MQNVRQTLLSQYANAPRIQTLIAGWNQMLDPASLIAQWYQLVWNLQTAQGYGLDVWGRIVGVPRVLSLSAQSYLGFFESSDLTQEGFGQVPWYSGGDATNNYRLADDGYRQLIYAKALANISDGSVIALNTILTTLFAGQGDAYVRDNGDMTITYVFKFVPTAVQVSIIQNSGVLPRPAGVSVAYSIQSD
ncbi:DUF2612 domain-containing protein [Acetobacter syzygii]|uniref:DUF2612 domain-containing protein n=1 Tax=Acetobacter syzygii TaxID=146476 RepID=A0A270BIJ3_9PROT|nr:DUF2612 domain-containing protein [Acetobacter syzygii]NSL91390.1 DUF2612 domain-containing protein [Acetobacter syzygii]PAL24764.1 hypothetical protein B9K05_08685 [Acetobacter syzygii]PAL24878.1 hypothetical protein B9K04_08175 [Acetobacter syzygii]GAN70684.1 hypothetical protein Absy_008_197 [Acetobacter syzygii]GBR65571.1 hypothetical protein AA0483_1912 [Acetobacter syzygii NRIC 0483]